MDRPMWRADAAMQAALAEFAVSSPGGGGGQDIHARGERPPASLTPCPLVPCLRAASALPHLQTLNKGLRRSGFSGQPEQATLLSEGQGGKALS